MKSNIYCTICGNQKCDLLKLHFYVFYKCLKCEHIFSDTNEIASEEYRIKYLKNLRNEQGHLIQGLVTQKYHEWHNPSLLYKIKITEHYMNNNPVILDCNTSDGSFIKTCQNDSIGLSNDLDIKMILKDTKTCYSSIEKIEGRQVFDIILMVDYLEYQYSPYEVMIDAYRLCKKSGSILIAVPFGQDPRKTYQGMTHIFSRSSIKRFAENVNPKSQVRYNKHNATVIINPYEH